MAEKTETGERRVTDVPSGIPGVCVDEPGTVGVDPEASGVDPGASGVDPEASGVDPGASGVDPAQTGGKNAEQAGPEVNDPALLRALRERLTAAEAENRRLEESCRQARSERDEALRREETLRREDVLRRYLAEKGLSGDAADIALRGLSGDAVRLEGGGLAAESREMLDGLMEGPFRPLFRIGGQNGDGGLRGVPLEKPPVEIGSMSREEILSIRDGTERRRAMLDNPGVFGL